MSGHRHPSGGSLKWVVSALAGVLLAPCLLLALLPMLVMFVPVAVVAIPVIAPMMLSGTLAAHWERRQRALQRDAASQMKRAPVVVR